MRAYVPCKDYVEGYGYVFERSNGGEKSYQDVSANYGKKTVK